MECKIYYKKQTSDKNDEIITYYIVSIKDDFYLICDFDFKGEADLLKAKKSYITVKEPIEQHYLVQKAKTNTMDDFKYAFSKAFMDKIVDRMDNNEQFFTRILDDEEFKNALMEYMIADTYDRLREESA